MFVWLASEQTTHVKDLVARDGRFSQWGWLGAQLLYALGGAVAGGLVLSARRGRMGRRIGLLAGAALPPLFVLLSPYLITNSWWPWLARQHLVAALFISQPDIFQPVAAVAFGIFLIALVWLGLTRALTDGSMP